MNWGSVALVTYLPEPLGSFLTELRRYLPGADHPEAHITLLPPRTLSLPVEAASREITQTLDGVTPFSLELGAVKAFPQTNMLHLSIEGGRQELVRLHASLNSGELRADEDFEYIPHLTLSGPLITEELAGALERANQLWNAAGPDRRFMVNEAVLLWQPGACSDKGWNRLASYPVLGAANRYSNIGN